MKSCTPAIPLWFPKKWLFGFFILEKQLASQYMFLVKSVSFFILEKQLASQNIFLVKSELFLQHISFLFSINQRRYNHNCFSKISRSFCGSRNWWIIVVILEDNSLRFTILSQKILRPFPTFQLRSFLKNIKNFLCKWKIVNNRIIPSTHAIRKIAILSD